MGKLIDLTGQRFGRLVVLERAENKGKAVAWMCKCDCGNIIAIRSKNLISGATKSCGCLHNEQLRERTVQRNTTHSKSKSRLFKIWAGMIQRCYNPNNPQYIDYGGRGIKICDEWHHDFEAFWTWAYANGYKDNLTIDRINNNSNYEPTNCRWVDYKEQNRNQRSNHLITYCGETKPLSEWAEQLNINRHTLLKRLQLGWSTEKTLETPVRGLKK